MAFYNNLFFWIGMFGVTFLLFLMETIFLIILAKKTHAIKEFKATFGGKPIAMFFMDSGFVEWKPVTPEAGIIQDEMYGSFIINEKGTYVDKTTKAIIIPFDASVAPSVNMKAAKLADNLKHILRDEKQMIEFRKAIMDGTLDESLEVQVLRDSIQLSSLRGTLNAMIPHSITAKIEKMVANRLSQYGKINVFQVIIVFAAILGAIVMGYILIKTVAGGGGGGVTSAVAGAATAIPG